jgi:hypothetical protein
MFTPTERLVRVVALTFVVIVLLLDLFYWRPL